MKRRSKRKKALAGYAVGSFVGGLVPVVVFTLLGGFFAPLPRDVLLIGLALTGGVLIVRDVGLVAFRLPQNERLIPRSVLERGPLQAGFGFGVRMATGFHTHLPTGAPYFLAACLLLAGLETWVLAITVAVVALVRTGMVWYLADELPAEVSRSIMPMPSVLSASSIVLGLGAAAFSMT